MFLFFEQGVAQGTLAVTTREAGAALLVLGRSGDTFDSFVSLPSTAGAIAGIATFVDSDANQDVVVANALGGPDLTLLLAQGAGDFQSSDIEIAGFQSPAGLARGDLNGDGRDDVLVFSDAANVGAYLPGLPAGGLGTPVLINMPSARKVALADLNADGFVDIVVARRDGGGASILLQDPSSLGAFPGVQTVAGNLDVRDVLVRDLIGDDKEEIVLLSTGNISLVAQAASSSFAAPVELAPQGGSAMAVSDFDGDDIPDVAVVGGMGASSYGRVFLGQLGAFTSGGSFDVGERPIAIVAADWTGDGVPEIATLDLSSQSVTVSLRD